jgi:hypothetical protein
MELFNSWLLIPDSTSLILNPCVLYIYVGNFHLLSFYTGVSIACSVFSIQNDINTFKERMGWLNMYLPMSLFWIPYGQGSGTTVAIPINICCKRLEMMNMKRVSFLVVAIKLLRVKTMYILIWIRYLWDSLYVSLSVDLSCTYIY